MYVRTTNVVSFMVGVLPSDGARPPPPQTVDDKLPSIPSTNSLTGGASRDGLGCTDDLGNETADSMSDGDDTLSGHALTLPQLVANTSDLLVPPKTGSPKRQKPVCQPQRNSLEFDIISFSELQLDVRKMP